MPNDAKQSKKEPQAAVQPSSAEAFKEANDPKQTTSVDNTATVLTESVRLMLSVIDNILLAHYVIDQDTVGLSLDIKPEGTTVSFYPVVSYDEHDDIFSDPDLYSKIQDFCIDLNQYNAFENVEINEDTCAITFKTKLSLYKILHDYVTDSSNPVTSTDTKLVINITHINEEPLQQGQYEEALQPQKNAYFRRLQIEEVRQHFTDEETKKRYLFNVDPTAYTSKEDFEHACYKSRFTSLNYSLGHILKLIMQEDGIKPTGVIGYDDFLHGNTGGYN